MPRFDITTTPSQSARREISRRPLRGHSLIFDSLEDRRLTASDLIATSFPITPSPVEDQSFTAVVAKFTDADHNTDPAQYAATIQWGNGKVTRGEIVADPQGGFDVVGSYTFPKAGPFRVTVQVGDTDGDTASVSTTNIVADASISATGQKVSLRHGRSVNDAIVATFSSADASLKARDFSATVNWGDGRSSAGIIHKVGSTGNFEVLASHTFRSAGTFSIETSIHQGGAGTALNFFTESDLISDGAVAADHVNPNLVNPWGLVAPNPGDFWDSNNGTGTSSLFDSFGNINTKLPFVTIPAPAGDPNPAAPSGVVFSGSSAFTVTNGTQSGPAAFIFATEDGTIAGWNPKVSTNATAPSTTAVLAVDNSATGAVYKGLTIFNIPTGNPLAAGQYLFVTNFHAGTIEVYNQNFQAVTLPAGEFQDPSIPAGFAPFGIQTLNGDLYVTYAKQDAEKHDDVAGPGNGYVDVYSPSGALLRRLGGPGVQTELNSPWGLTIAPSNFGQFSNDILVGNFGNSHINAFDPSTGAFLGQLTGANGKPLILDGGVKGSDEKGLWGLFAFGASAAAGSTNTVYFSSGFNDESDGLFGSLTATSVAMATAPGVVVVAK